MIKRGMYGKNKRISLMVEAGGYVVNGKWRIAEQDGALAVAANGTVLDVEWLCDWPGDIAVYDYNQLMDAAQRRLGS